MLHPKLPNGFFQQALKVATLSKEWSGSGLLLGKIEPSTTMKRVRKCKRLGRLDWVNGYIDLNQYCHQVLEIILLPLASDPSPELHARLSEEINLLNSL